MSLQSPTSSASPSLLSRLSPANPALPLNGDAANGAGDSPTPQPSNSRNRIRGARKPNHLSSSPNGAGGSSLEDGSPLSSSINIAGTSPAARRGSNGFGPRSFGAPSPSSSFKSSSAMPMAIPIGPSSASPSHPPNSHGSSIGGTTPRAFSNSRIDHDRAFAAIALSLSVSPTQSMQAAARSPRAPSSFLSRSPAGPGAPTREPARHLQPLPGQALEKDRAKLAAAAAEKRDTSTSRWASSPSPPAAGLGNSPSMSAVRLGPASVSPSTHDHQTRGGAVDKIDSMLSRLRTQESPAFSSHAPPSSSISPSKSSAFASRSPSNPSAFAPSSRSPSKPSSFASLASRSPATASPFGSRSPSKVQSPYVPPAARSPEKVQERAVPGLPPPGTRIQRAPDPVKRPALGGRSRWATDDDDVDDTVVHVDVPKQKNEEEELKATPATPTVETPTSEKDDYCTAPASPVLAPVPTKPPSLLTRSLSSAPGPAAIISPASAVADSPIPRPATPPPPSPLTRATTPPPPSRSPSPPPTPSWDSMTSSSSHIDWAEDDDDDLPPIDDQWLAEPLSPSIAHQTLPPSRASLAAAAQIISPTLSARQREPRSRESSAGGLPWSTPSTPGGGSEGGGGRGKKRGGKKGRGGGGGSAGFEAASATTSPGSTAGARTPLNAIARDPLPHQSPHGSSPSARGGRGAARGGRGGMRGGGRGGAAGGAGPEPALFNRLSGMGAPSPRGGGEGGGRGRRGAGAGMAGAGGGARW